MKILKSALGLLCLIVLNSCASGYKTINPNNLNYLARNDSEGITLEYKYNLLHKKYAKKEFKKGLKLVAVKLTNNTSRDLVFGRDFELTDINGSRLAILSPNEVFYSLKQQPATYLLYLLLTPLNLYTSRTNSNGFQETTSSTPIGIVLGPGLAGGNLIAAGSANKKFKTDLLNYNIDGITIKKGETAYGLIGIKTNSFGAIKAVLR